MIILFACLIIGHQLVVFIARRKFDLFDVTLLIDVVLFTMWVYAPLVDPLLRFRLENDWSFAIVTFCGILFLYLGLHLPLGKRSWISKMLLDAPITNTRWLRLALMIFVIFTSVVTLQKVQFSEAGLWGYLSGDRLSMYRAILNQDPQGSIADRLIWFTQPVLLLWLAVALEQRNWMQSGFIYLILLASIVLIATTRLPVILTLLLPIVYYYRGRNFFKTIPIAVLIGVVFVVLLFVLNIWRGQGVSAGQMPEISFAAAFDSISTNFAPLRGYEMLWQLHDNDQLFYEYGLSYLYIPLTAIPRALWAEKPLVSFEPRWTTYFFGQHYAMASEGWGVWTFTVWGEGLAQFGEIGVLLNLLMYGGLVSWANNLFGQRKIFSLAWFYYSVLAATYLRSSFSALAWTFLQAFVPLVVFYSLSVKKRTRGVQEQIH